MFWQIQFLPGLYALRLPVLTAAKTASGWFSRFMNGCRVWGSSPGWIDTITHFSTPLWKLCATACSRAGTSFFSLRRQCCGGARGWSVVELAWAELLQDNLHKKRVRHCRMFRSPCFFLEKGSERLLRTRVAVRA